MKKNKARKKGLNLSIEEYLQWCQDDISKDEYFAFERIRAKELFEIDPSVWINLIENQSLECFYCHTDLRVIQQLILKGYIKPRKRGTGGYSGIHFELDHKNANKSDNNIENLVASCYYCNNDKSNTFDSGIFKEYFGAYKKEAFNKLFSDKNLEITNTFRHHLKGKPK